MNTLILAHALGMGAGGAAPEAPTITVSTPDAHWRFEDNLLDSSGNDHTATAGEAFYSAAKYGQGFALGGGNYPSCDAAGLLALGAADFTIGFWALTTNKAQVGGTGYFGIIGDLPFDVLANTSGDLVLDVDGNQISLGTIENDVPFHVAVAFSVSTYLATGYKNGSLIDSDNLDELGEWYSVNMGNISSGPLSVPGWIDDVRVYAGLATEANALSMMADLYDPPIAALARHRLGLGIVV